MISEIQKYSGTKLALTSMRQKRLFVYLKNITLMPVLVMIFDKANL